MNAYRKRKAARSRKLGELKRKPKNEILDIYSKDWRPKQREFVRHFLQHGIAWRAVIEAGYVTDRINAQKIAGELRRTPHVALYLEEINRQRSERFAITPDRIISALAEIAFGGLQNVVRIGDDGRPVIDMSFATEAEIAAIAEIQTEEKTRSRGEDTETSNTVKLKHYDRLRALEMLGKLTRFKLFAAQDINLTGDVGELIAAARRRRIEMKTIDAVAVDPVSSQADDNPTAGRPIPAIAPRRNAKQRDIRPPDPAREARRKRIAGD